MNRNLILGGAYGYDAEALRIFLCSARENVPSADVLLTTDRATPEFARELAAHHPRVRLIQAFDADWRRRAWRTPRRRKKLKRMTAARARYLSLLLRTPWRARAVAAFHAAAGKYFWCLDAVRRGHADGADKILFLDVRDLYFQGDPFEGVEIPEGGLVVGAEPRLITQDSYVYRLIRRVYSEATAEQLRDQPILCAGSMLGNRKSIERYMQAMVDELIRGAPYFFGVMNDQPIHCKVLLADRKIPIRITHEGNPWLTNILYVKGEQDLFVLEDEGLKTREGELVRIVHRYDRIKALVDWASRRYRDG